MRNLIIDIGNTLQKAAICDNGEITSKISKTSIHIIDLESFINKARFDNTIVSESGVLEEDVRNYLLSNFNTHFLSPKTILPIEILYKTPEQLGKDRIAAAVAAWSRFPEANTLVIQAGTCLVYDFVNDKGQYTGGAISPGLSMRFKALHHYTARLPLISPDYNSLPTEPLLGDSTEGSIICGVVNGVAYEIDSYIARYKSVYPDLKVILTGGDMSYLKKSIKNTIFANSNLVFEGLNKILETNAVK